MRIQGLHCRKSKSSPYTYTAKKQEEMRAVMKKNIILKLIRAIKVTALVMNIDKEMIS